MISQSSPPYYPLVSTPYLTFTRTYMRLTTQPQAPGLAHPFPFLPLLLKGAAFRIMPDHVTALSHAAVISLGSS